MKITFLLPSGGAKPTGGFKVVYEYANALVARGHEVTVVHPASLWAAQKGSIDIPTRTLLKFIGNAIIGRWRPDRWFRMDPRVRMLWLPHLSSELIPDAHAIVATWWRTAELLADWPESKGRKYYLIQHVETWGGTPEEVFATWRLPYERIVIAQWLVELAESMGQSAHYIPNGLNFVAFGTDVAPHCRRPSTAAMLYHEFDWKGSHDGLAALQLAKKHIPELTLQLFGTARAPNNLPSWITYHRDPPQVRLRQIYNQSAVFVAPSWSEGWPLPPAESLMCGCALACTDIGGHREYAFHRENALLSPLRNPQILAENIAELMSDHELRFRLSARAQQIIRQFTWEQATDKLESVLLSYPSRAVRPSATSDSELCRNS